MKIVNKSPTEIIDIIRKDNPEIDAVIALAESIKSPYKGSMQQYQAACLYALAKRYNRKDEKIVSVLEIGTGKGYSTSYLVQALPKAWITSLSVRADEQLEAKNAVERLGFNDVDFKTINSRDYFVDDEDTYDLIFVDGDHARVQKDLVYWNSLNKGGLFLFHDYCPHDAANPQPHVYRVLNEFSTEINQPFDVEIVDNVKIGMVGFYK